MSYTQEFRDIVLPLIIKNAAVFSKGTAETHAAKNPDMIRRQLIAQQAVENVRSQLADEGVLDIEDPKEIVSTIRQEANNFLGTMNAPRKRDQAEDRLRKLLMSLDYSKKLGNRLGSILDEVAGKASGKYAKDFSAAATDLASLARQPLAAKLAETMEEDAPSSVGPPHLAPSVATSATDAESRLSEEDEEDEEAEARKAREAEIEADVEAWRAKSRKAREAELARHREELEAFTARAKEVVRIYSDITNALRVAYTPTTTPKNREQLLAKVEIATASYTKEIAELHSKWKAEMSKAGLTGVDIGWKAIGKQIGAKLKKENKLQAQILRASGSAAAAADQGYESDLSTLSLASDFSDPRPPDETKPPATRKAKKPAGSGIKKARKPRKG